MKYGGGDWTGVGRKKVWPRARWIGGLGTTGTFSSHLGRIDVIGFTPLSPTPTSPKPFNSNSYFPWRRNPVHEQTQNRKCSAEKNGLFGSVFVSSITLVCPLHIVLLWKALSG